MSYSGAWITQFPGNFNWSNAALVTKGMAPYGAVALGEIDDGLRAPDGAAERAGRVARGMVRDGRAARESGATRPQPKAASMTAGNYYLRAGMYYFTGERFIYPGARKREVGARRSSCSRQDCCAAIPTSRRSKCRSKAASLPALFMKAPGVGGRAPTVVVFDGMDNCKEMSVLFNGLEFAARGWNTLAIDGPGQGESLRLRELYARHDYEGAGHGRVRLCRGARRRRSAEVVVMGYSFGGYYAGARGRVRAALCRRRRVRGAALGPRRMAARDQAPAREPSRTTPRSRTSTSAGSWAAIDDADAAIERPSGFRSPMSRRRSTMPFLIVHGEDDKVVRSRPRTSSTRRSARAEAPEDLHPRGRRRYHVQADNRQVGVDYIADWIEDIFAKP